MAKRLYIQLPPGWVDGTKEHPGGYFFYRNGSKGVLQISFAENMSGKPLPTAPDLVTLARKTGERHNPGELLETSSGPCLVGTYGTAVYRSPQCAHTQFWYLSNGYDIVFVTFISSEEPEPEDLLEARQIVTTIGLSDGGSAAGDAAS